MSIQENYKDHPAYHGAVCWAAKLAFENQGKSFSVYFNGKAVFVRPSEDPLPDNSKLVCIAQFWAGNTVQLRFDGAHSEWMVL